MTQFIIYTLIIFSFVDDGFLRILIVMVYSLTAGWESQGCVSDSNRGREGGRQKRDKQETRKIMEPRNESWKETLIWEGRLVGTTE